MNLILLGIIQGLYIVYMLNFFKTCYSVAHPLSYFENSYLYHPIGKSEKPISNVCQFGHQVSWLLAGFVIIRNIMIARNVGKTILKRMSTLILIITVIMSMLNFNVVLYLLPHYILEYYLIKTNYNL